MKLGIYLIPGATLIFLPLLKQIPSSHMNTYIIVLNPEDPGS